MFFLNPERLWVTPRRPRVLLITFRKPSAGQPLIFGHVGEREFFDRLYRGKMGIWVHALILGSMTDPPPHKTPVVFYRTRAGAEVLRQWLRGLACRSPSLDPPG